MKIEDRLKEYCEWLQEASMSYFPQSTMLYRIIREGAGASHSTAQQSDGGIGAMVDRMAGAIERDKRCREVNEAVYNAPDDHFAVVQATYGIQWRDAPRSFREAANIMGINFASYRWRRLKAFRWLQHRLNIPLDKQHSTNQNETSIGGVIPLRIASA